jgi:ribosomal protein S21
MQVSVRDNNVDQALRALKKKLQRAIAGCSAQFRNHGYVPPAEDLDALIIGVETRDAILDSLGAPTTQGVIDGGNLYYVRSRFKQFGAFAPQEISREVVALTFDASGTLQNVERYGLQDGAIILLDHRVTETSIADQNIIRRLISTIGGPSASQFIK